MSLLQGLKKRKVALENLAMSNPITGPAYSLYKTQELDRQLFGPGPRGLAVMATTTGKDLAKQALSQRMTLANMMAAAEHGVQRGAEATKRNYVPQGAVETVAAGVGENFTPLNVALSNPEALAQAAALRAQQAQALNYAMGEAGSFGGVKAKHFNEAPGKFSSLADKMQRFEIDDSGAKINPNLNLKWDEFKIATTKLGDYLEHPELYKQYPELKDITLELNPNIDNAGSYIDSGIAPRHIQLRVDPFWRNESVQTHMSALKEYQTALTDESALNRLANDAKISPDKLREYLPGWINDEKKVIEHFKKELPYGNDQVKSTLLHEIQHAIQEKEGFARGGNTSEFENIFGVETEKGKLLTKLLDFREAYATNPNPKVKADIDFLENELRKLGKDAFESYQRLAGEVEARAVSARMKMSPEQRFKTQPLESQGIAVKDMIVRKDKSPIMQALKARAKGKK